MNGVTLREVVDTDAPFLFHLFCAVRGPEYEPMSLAPDQLQMLLQMQFRAQTASYEAQYPASDHDIVMVDGTAAGRTLVHRSPSQFVLADISLLPQYRNRGIGTALVSQLIEDARDAGAPLACSVAVSNAGSLRFHQRLGFRVMKQDEVYYELERLP